MGGGVLEKELFAPEMLSAGEDALVWVGWENRLSAICEVVQRVWLAFWMELDLMVHPILPCRPACMLSLGQGWGGSFSF